MHQGACVNEENFNHPIRQFYCPKALAMPPAIPLLQSNIQLRAEPIRHFFSSWGPCHLANVHNLDSFHKQSSPLHPKPEEGSADLVQWAIMAILAAHVRWTICRRRHDRCIGPQLAIVMIPKYNIPGHLHSQFALLRIHSPYKWVLESCHRASVSLAHLQAGISVDLGERCVKLRILDRGETCLVEVVTN